MVSPLSTPINDLWGQAGASTAVAPGNAYGRRNATSAAATPANGANGASVGTDPAVATATRNETAV